MKKLTPILVLFVILLSSCAGSDTYQGKWKAMDEEGNKYEIDFAPKSFTVKDSAGKTATFEYTQNSIKTENSVETYGINLGDGRSYIIHFPIASDESKGIIADAAGGLPLYTISRGEYIQYRDIFKLK